MAFNLGSLLRGINTPLGGARRLGQAAEDEMKVRGPVPLKQGESPAAPAQSVPSVPGSGFPMFTPPGAAPEAPTTPAVPQGVERQIPPSLGSGFPMFEGRPKDPAQGELFPPNPPSEPFAAPVKPGGQSPEGEIPYDLVDRLTDETYDVPADVRETVSKILSDARQLAEQEPKGNLSPQGRPELETEALIDELMRGTVEPFGSTLRYSGAGGPAMEMARDYGPFRSDREYLAGGRIMATEWGYPVVYERASTQSPFIPDESTRVGLFTGITSTITGPVANILLGGRQRSDVRVADADLMPGNKVATVLAIDHATAAKLSNLFSLLGGRKYYGVGPDVMTGVGSAGDKKTSLFLSRSAVLKENSALTKDEIGGMDPADFAGLLNVQQLYRMLFKAQRIIHATSTALEIDRSLLPAVSFPGKKRVYTPQSSLPAEVPSGTPVRKDLNFFPSEVIPRGRARGTAQRKKRGYVASGSPEERDTGRVNYNKSMTPEERRLAIEKSTTAAKVVKEIQSALRDLGLPFDQDLSMKPQYENDFDVIMNAGERFIAKPTWLNALLGTKQDDTAFMGLSSLPIGLQREMSELLKAEGKTFTQAAEMLITNADKMGTLGKAMLPQFRMLYTVFKEMEELSGDKGIVRIYAPKFGVKGDFFQDFEENTSTHGFSLSGATTMSPALGGHSPEGVRQAPYGRPGHPSSQRMNNFGNVGAFINVNPWGPAPMMTLFHELLHAIHTHTFTAGSATISQGGVGIGFENASGQAYSPLVQRIIRANRDMMALSEFTAVLIAHNSNKVMQKLVDFGDELSNSYASLATDAPFMHIYDLNRIYVKRGSDGRALDFFIESNNPEQASKLAYMAGQKWWANNRYVKRSEIPADYTPLFDPNEQSFIAALARVQDPVVHSQKKAFSTEPVYVGASDLVWNPAVNVLLSHAHYSDSGNEIPGTNPFSGLGRTGAAMALPFSDATSAGKKNLITRPFPSQLAPLTSYLYTYDFNTPGSGADRLVRGPLSKELKKAGMPSPFTPTKIQQLKDRFEEMSRTGLVAPPLQFQYHFAPMEIVSFMSSSPHWMHLASSLNLDDVRSIPDIPQELKQRLLDYLSNDSYAVNSRDTTWTATVSSLARLFNSEAVGPRTVLDAVLSTHWMYLSPIQNGNLSSSVAERARVMKVTAARRLFTPTIHAYKADEEVFDDKYAQQIRGPGAGLTLNLRQRAGRELLATKLAERWIRDGVKPTLDTFTEVLDSPVMDSTEDYFDFNNLGTSVQRQLSPNKTRYLLDARLGPAQTGAPDVDPIPGGGAQPTYSKNLVGGGTSAAREVAINPEDYGELNPPWRDTGQTRHMQASTKEAGPHMPRIWERVQKPSALSGDEFAGPRNMMLSKQFLVKGGFTEADYDLLMREAEQRVKVLVGGAFEFDELEDALTQFRKISAKTRVNGNNPMSRALAEEVAMFKDSFEEIIRGFSGGFVEERGAREVITSAKFSPDLDSGVSEDMVLNALSAIVESETNMGRAVEIFRQFMFHALTGGEQFKITFTGKKSSDSPLRNSAARADLEHRLNLVLKGTSILTEDSPTFFQTAQ